MALLYYLAAGVLQVTEILRLGRKRSLPIGQPTIQYHRGFLDVIKAFTSLSSACSLRDQSNSI